MAKRSIEIVAEDNDFFRKTITNHKSCAFNEAIGPLTKEDKEAIVDAIKQAISPTEERQRGTVTVSGQELTWLIRYYNQDKKGDPFIGPVTRALEVTL